MAGYTLIGSVSVTQVLSPTVSQATVVATIRTIPTGIIAATPVSQADFDSGAAAAHLEVFADSIETIIAGGKAVGGTGTSALDASGLTAYFVTFEVGYNPPGSPAGTITADVDVPVRDLAIATDDPAAAGQAELLIDAAYQNLVALSGG